MSKEHELIRQAAAVAKAGDRAKARFLLTTALRIDARNPQTWLGLAAVAGNRREAVRHLERVLELCPGHPQALAWLQRLHKPPAPPPKPAWSCPFCEAGAAAPPPQCPRCHACPYLDDPERLLAERAVDRDVLERTIARLEEQAQGGVTFDLQLQLGLLLLNVGRAGDGLRRLRFASQMHPGDAKLRAQVDELFARWRERQNDESDGGARRVEKTVLVVDDSPTVLKIVGMTLARRGHRVVIASDGLQAMTKLRECAPDLVLLDITMPRFDGYQLCKAIKGNEETRETPVVFLSGRDGLFDKVRGRMAGSADYITKPFDPAALIAVVDRHLGEAG